MSNSVELSVVTPVFNEEEVVGSFFNAIRDILDQQGITYEIVFVDDGSRDRTFLMLAKISESALGRVRVIRLARNFGHQLAITAGLQEAQGRAVVVMDSDLQDPPSVIPEFLKRWREGHEVVYGRRLERKGETWFKKWTAHVFYRTMRRMTHVDIPVDVGDFYLLDRKVVDLLNNMKERHRFLRGLIAWVGFRRFAVDYVRRQRQAGKTKFSFWKMLRFSFDAITAFSFAPLRAVLILGFMTSVGAFLGILFAIYMKIFHNTVWGWASIMVIVLFIGGIQLLAIGMIGEYLARIGDDVKRRPLYTIQERLG